MKRLYRSRRDVFLAGVCGGIAEYFNIDASLIRLGMVILTLASSGLGLIAYLVAAVVIPEDPNREGSTMNATNGFNSGQPGAEGPAGFAGSENDFKAAEKNNTGDGFKPFRNDTGSRKRYPGLFLIILGLFLLLRNFIPGLDFSILAACLLIFIGFSMMSKRR